ncbi:protein OS-9 isoform X2 [Rhinoderma darwinii]|uniref:protein OS-9 isoform X2 n=1 Tax=Rhinoderma darwinii TaxID=43563 RepID=UPI003F66747B
MLYARGEKMAVPGVGAFLFGALWLLFGVTSASLGFLNLEELTDMKYGIEILSEPVIKGQSKADNVVTIASKYKQNYECKLPAVAVRFQQEKDEDRQTYSGLGISELLKAMDAAPCLTKTKDWWTYEFCYGKHIQQYHIEESEVKGDILYLGHYQSEFDWNNETAKASKHHRLKRYHSQMYVNGSKCDLNGKLRETEVRFVCEEGSGDYIARVDEPQSCSYVLTIHTTRICNHPFLRPPSTGTPQPIRCHPALSPEQYVEYVRAQVYDTKRIVEELSEELKTLDLKTLAPKGIGSLDQGKHLKTAETKDEHEKVDIESKSPLESESTETAVNEEPEETETDLWNKIVRPQGTETPAPDTDPTEETFPSLHSPDGRTEGSARTLRYRIIRNPEDLVKFIDDLKKTPKKDDDSDAESNELHSEEDSNPVSEIRDLEDEDEQVLLQEFEKELENILLTKSDVSQIKENVKTDMEQEFDNIIDEAQKELETEGLKGEFDRKQASKSLATTLNKLIDKLDNTAEEKAEEAPATESDEVNTQDHRDPAIAPTDDRSDGRVKIRVTKIRRGSSEHPERKEMSSENPQLRHIENVVKDLLEKEGLKAEGKIEIKILTGGFGEDDDGHWLSEEDTRNLKDIFFNILIQGSEDAHKEQKRQQQLENNYRFVWNPNSDDSKSTSTSTDSDDVDI